MLAIEYIEVIETFYNLESKILSNLIPESVTEDKFLLQKLPMQPLVESRVEVHTPP